MSKASQSTLPVNVEEFLKKMIKEGNVENFAAKLVNEYFERNQKLKS